MQVRSLNLRSELCIGPSGILPEGIIMRGELPSQPVGGASGLQNLRYRGYSLFCYLRAKCQAADRPFQANAAAPACVLH